MKDYIYIQDTQASIIQVNIHIHSLQKAKSEILLSAGDSIHVYLHLPVPDSGQVFTC